MGMPQDRPGEIGMMQGPYVHPPHLSPQPTSPHLDLVANVTHHIVSCPYTL